MKKLLNIFSILFSVIIIASCGGEEDEQGGLNPIAPEKYILSVTTSGQGKVFVNGTEITSILEFEKGESVELEAIPAEGYYFEKWAKDGSEISVNNPYETVIITDVIYTAVFKEKQQEKVKIEVTTATEGGSAKVNGNSYVEVEQGDDVLLSATPSEGYIFVNWTLDGKQISTEKDCNVRASEDAIYVANFAKKDVKYVVYVEMSEGGNATVNGVSSVEVIAGTSVTLSATANSGYEFVNWTVNGIEVSTDASYKVAISSNITYKANYKKKEIKYGVSVESGEGGTANVNGVSSVEVVAGTSVTLSATANSDYEFVNWTANGVEVSKSASFQVIVNSAVTYKANFKKIVKYIVFVEAGEGGNANVNGVSSVEVVEGTTVTLSATANSDYEFVNWTANGTEVSTDASYKVAISSNITYKANFEKKDATPSTPDELINMVKTQNMEGLSVTQLVNCKLWNAVMNYSNGMTPENLKLNYGNLMPASNVSYEQIIDIFLARLNSITGESFRLPTSNEMKQIVSYITFKSPVNYVWCNDYKDDVNLYSAGPEGPDIPVTPSTRLVFGKNSSVQSISMTYKNKTIGFVIIKE